MDNLSVITSARGERPPPPPGPPGPPAVPRPAEGPATATATATDASAASDRASAPPPAPAAGRTAADAYAYAEAPTIVLPRPRPGEASRTTAGPGGSGGPRRSGRTHDGAAAARRAVATASGSARATLEPLGGQVERLMRERLGVTLRAPGRGGRIFLTMAGGAVILIALGSVVLGIGGGPAALRPLTSAVTPTTAVADPTGEPRPPVNEVAGIPITATRTYLLTTYAPGSGHRSRLEASPRELPVGRQYQHLPRRGDDHLSTAEVVFPVLPAPAACVSRVELRLTLLGTEGAPDDEGPYPLAAYPSALTSLATGKVPSTVPTLDLVANRPRGSLNWSRYDETRPTGDLPAGEQPAGDQSAGDLAAADQPTGGDATGAVAPGGPVEISADITELYQRWVAGMPTAEGNLGVPPGTPLVLAIRPALTNVLGTWRHTYGGSATSTPPRLVWDRRVHCA
ncbi:hypothetical protein [Pseudofrankia saprophytica]|uniref:hypothetical protein n=1 Tax=Pseudofrankia saprophytica TaxID=298655 RepID=UPI000234C298|nr:hypothetical protein [Pseudofrankia saprophytica]